AALLAISVWGFFAEADIGYLVSVVTGFVFMIVALPSLLWRIRRHGHDPAPARGRIERKGRIAPRMDEERFRGEAGALERLGRCRRQPVADRRLRARHAGVRD